jgi:serine/threonine protein phosphatase PrpC
MPLYYNPRNLLEGNALINSLINSHQTLFKENEEKSVNQRAGASLICAAKAESVLILAGVGNCMAYQFRQGNLTKIFHEDILSSLSFSSQDLKFRTAPLNALGMYPELTYQMKEVRIMSGDKIIFLTDGVYAPLKEDEIKYTFTSSYPDDHSRINNLLNLSNTRGNLDNQTLMILEF